MKLRHHLNLIDLTVVALLVVGLTDTALAQQPGREGSGHPDKARGLQPRTGGSVVPGAARMPSAIGRQRPAGPAALAAPTSAVPGATIGTAPSVGLPLAGAVRPGAVRPNAPAMIGRAGIGISGTGMARPGTGPAVIGGAAAPAPGVGRITGTGLRPKR